MKLDKFFDSTTMSAHLREKAKPMAKKGMPGKWKFVSLSSEPLKQEELEQLYEEIIEESREREDGFVEIAREGSTIVQLGKYRIVITRPPFSDGWEITAVRPVKRLGMDDYNLSEKLNERVAKQAEGILIAGSPGMGKSTFAQALAEHYSLQNKVVKTVEAPRDLVLPDTITQYAISHGDAQEIRDILLLSRPDHTIFDEMRNTDDFKLFADLRLAGVGMVGVVHATAPIDAIQRFIGRVEMGVIPQIIDTVVFMHNGEVSKVLSLKMTVKVPSGMTEADLARPCVVVNDFETGKLEFEIYSYGEQTVVVPVEDVGIKVSGVSKLAAKTIEQEFAKYTDSLNVEISSDKGAVVYVPDKVRSRIIGKDGSNINSIEGKLGIKIDVRTLKNRTSRSKVEVPYKLDVKTKNFVFNLGIDNQDKDADIYVDGEYLVTVKSGPTGIVKVKKKNDVGKVLFKAFGSGSEVKIMV